MINPFGMQEDINNAQLHEYLDLFNFYTEIETRANSMIWFVEINIRARVG